MEIYREVMAAGNLSIEISVRKKINQEKNGCWVICTARNHEGRTLWQTTLSRENGSPIYFHDVEEALHETRNLFTSPDEEYEFQGLANKELDKTLYYLSLF
jgi:hypothetical protein